MDADWLLTGLKNVFWETDIKRKSCFKTTHNVTLVTLNFWSVCDSLRSLVFWSLIRDKGRFASYKHWQTETITDVSFQRLVFLCLTYLRVFSLSLWLWTNRTKIHFALLSYNWHITEVFMTHEWFIHLDQVVCLCLSSLLSGFPSCSFANIKLFKLLFCS